MGYIGSYGKKQEEATQIKLTVNHNVYSFTSAQLTKTPYAIPISRFEIDMRYKSFKKVKMTYCKSYYGMYKTPATLTVYDESGIATTIDMVLNREYDLGAIMAADKKPTIEISSIIINKNQNDIRYYPGEAWFELTP